jgi:hypothetical protein
MRDWRVNYVWSRSNVRRAGKRDVNEEDVIKALIEEFGAQVVKNSSQGVPDLLVTVCRGERVVTGYIEVKVRGNRLTADQDEFFSWYKGLIGVAWSPEDAIAVVNRWLAS